MVKADVRRDYYADLGLTPSAEIEDIKKQFRKLALKYHPDRNPGKELEFNPKFQAIQAANEILSDPQQRLRYDTDRLRAGYGKLYGPPKSAPPRKPPTNTYASTASPRPQASKHNTRPQSFHNGPSAGAQRYASYARAAPKQSWERAHEDGQTRADAYRGFQEMKGGAMPGGWAQFDPRTGRSGHPGAVPRPNPGQSARPKSAYEYFKTSPKPTAPESSARAQTSKKKQGFAPRAAGGDEPMAASTSSYTNARPRAANHFGAHPSPTARKAAAGFANRAENSSTPDFERKSSKYASTGGEKTCLSSDWASRSSGMRDSPSSPKPRPRTNPPSPTPPERGRHHSASPKFKFKANRGRNYDSTSSSDLSDDDLPPAQKPRAVPKSKLYAQQKHTGFHAQQNHDPRHDGKHDTTGTASRTEEPSVNAQSPKPTGNQRGAFKSSSHDNLRQPFSAESWSDFKFFIHSQTETKSAEALNNRGRASDKTPGGRSAHPASVSAHGSSSESTSQQKPTVFAEAKFRVDDWNEKLKDLNFTLPKVDVSQQVNGGANPQRPRSPRKPTRPTARTRPIPQPASVATEDEEARTTFDDDNASTAARPGGDGEAMDLDDDIPTKPAKTTTEPSVNNEGKTKAQPKPRPTSSGHGKSDSVKPQSKLFDMKNLGSTAPFVYPSNSGIDDLQDIHASLPFESRAKMPRNTVQGIRPRELVCPNPPRRPQPPQLVPIGIDTSQLALSRAAWDRYVGEMNAYMREWNAFNRRILRHFNARQEAIETGMAPSWIGAVGDSTRLRVNAGDNDDEDDGKGVGGNDSDDDMIAGSGKGGYGAYLRGLEEDTKVEKHWEVARENHRECILQLGELREWILNGGKLI